MKHVQVVWMRMRPDWDNQRAKGYESQVGGEGLPDFV